MQHNAAFHQGQHFLPRLKQSSGSELYSINHNLENPTSDPLSTQWTILYLLYQYVWDNPLEYKGLIRACLSDLFAFNVAAPSKKPNKAWKDYHQLSRKMILMNFHKNKEQYCKMFQLLQRGNM